MKYTVKKTRQTLVKKSDPKPVVLAIRAVIRKVVLRGA